MTRQALAAAVSALLAVSLARAVGTTPVSNLSITNTDSTATYSAGGSVTYTIVVSNSGPDIAIGATVTDAVAALPQVASTSWTCLAQGGATCTAGPVVGDVNDTVNVPKNGTLTYTLIVTTQSSAVGELVNTAKVTPPTGTSDPYPRNNTAIDTDTHKPPISDLSITKTDLVPTYTPGGKVTYTIVVGNAGPDGAVAAKVSDPVTARAQVLSASWMCVGAGGATCSPDTVAGDIDDKVDLPVGGTVTYTLTATLRANATGNLVNTATVAPPAGTTDPGPGPDTATDTDTAATIFYVATDGTDSATCPSSTPCLTIQHAIDNAGAGDTVIVRAGTYKECIVLVPGGGSGGVRVESEEFFTSGTNGATILDGAGVCDGVSPDPAGPVAKVFDGSALIGFVVKNGGDSGVWGLGAVAIVSNVISGSATSQNGGGVRLITGDNLIDATAKAQILSNVILSNTSGRDGAGIYVEATADTVPSVVEIIGNTVAGNTAGDGTVGASGAGIAVFTDTASAADSSRVVITGNTIDGNVAKNAAADATLAHGGGIFVATGSAGGFGTETVTLGTAASGNIVRKNVSEGFGGGLSIKLQPAPSGTHTVDVAANPITANTGKRGGGGAHLFVHAIDHPVGTSPGVVLRVTSNVVVGNHAQGDLSDRRAVGGGGIYAELQSDRTSAPAIVFEIAGNTIQGNDATTHGGGASLVASADDDPARDGATAPADAVISFHNNLVAKNAAHDRSAGGVSGGGVYAKAVAEGATALARLSQDFLTVVDNLTELGSGGFEWEDLHPPNSLGLSGATSFELSNSIVSGNDGYGVGGTIVPGPLTTVTFAYNDVFGNGSGNYGPTLTDPTGTPGNISVDPSLDALFLPRLCGPTIDAGDPAIDLGDPPIEPLPNGGRVNMGHLGNTASATRTFPDVNGDGTIDGLDVLGVAVSFGSLSGDPRFLAAADRDLDGDVDGDDLAYVSAFYAHSCP